MSFTRFQRRRTPTDPGSAAETGRQSPTAPATSGLARPVPPLIGTDDLTTPSWAQGYEQAASAGVWAVAATAPRLVAVLVRWAWDSSPRLTVLSVTAVLATAASTTTALWASAGVFARLLAQGPTPHRLLAAVPALALVAGAALSRGAAQAAAGAVAAALEPRIEQRAQNDLYTGLVDLDVLAYEDPDFTGLLDRVTTQGIPAIRQCASTVNELLTAIVLVAAAILAAGLLNPLLALLVLLTALPQAWVGFRSAQLRLDSFVRMLSAMRRRDLTGSLLSRREYATEVRAVTAGHLLLSEHRRISGELATEAASLSHRKNRLTTSGAALAGLGAVLCYSALGLLIYTNTLALPLAGAAIVAMRAAGPATVRAARSVSQLFENGIYVTLYQNCITEVRDRRRPAASRRLTSGPESIDLTGVCFRYPHQGQDVINDVNLTLRRGEVIALVGENGSGKSTLAKLITGLYLPTSGCVAWDDVPTHAIDPNQLHDRIALVVQDPMRWPTTARNNITIGRFDRDDPDDAALDHAATRSGADDVISQLPDGQNTVLSRTFQQGHDLSGGQWQRFGVARCLYRDAPVVIADEPTAAMDARAEDAVFASLRALSATGAQPRIIVLITHRLANIRHADRILVLDNGRIADQGRHEELIAREGTYQNLFALQARAYASETTT